MTGKERQELRVSLLQELYDVYFSNNGNGKQYTNEELAKDPERKLAYEYLVGRSQVHKVFPGGRNTVFTILPNGIDFIESLEK